MYVKELLKWPPVDEMSPNFACRDLLGVRFQKYMIGGHPASGLQFPSSGLHLSIYYTLEVIYVYLALQHLGPFIKVLTSKLKETENKAQFGGQDISIMLLRPETFKLAYGDHLGDILICQNSSTQK